MINNVVLVGRLTRDLDFANATVRGWENKKKHLENKLKEIRKEWGENNV